MNDKWVIINWIEKKDNTEGIAVISPFRDDKILVGLSVVTTIPNDEYNIIGEIDGL